MKAIELKNLLIHQISEINDVSFLNAIKTILDTKTNSKILKLTQKQKEEIIASKKEIEQGLFTDNVVMEKEIEGWLKAK
jgi:hypothetical protein